MTGAERAELEAGRRRIVALHRRGARLEAQLRQALEDSARGRKHELEREVAALRARDAERARSPNKPWFTATTSRWSPIG
jgi:hypothetical protein